jgi:hypothetical protein
MNFEVALKSRHPQIYDRPSNMLRGGRNIHLKLGFNSANRL